MRTKRYRFVLLSAFALLISITFTRCGEESDSIVQVFGGINSAQTADAYLLTVYEGIKDRSTFTDAFLIMPLLYSDQAKYVGSENSSWKQASEFGLTPSNSVLNTMFTDLYTLNSSLNVLFAEVDTTIDESLTDDIKDGLIGEARGIRGVLYYYLTQYWGEVPLLLDSDDQQVDSLVGNASAQALFDQIEADLLFAAENTSKNPLSSGNQRINEWSAKAYLARLYLSVGDYANARIYAEDVINNGDASLETSVSDIYAVTSSEHIWIIPEDEDDVALVVWFLPSFAGGQQVVVPRSTDFFEDGDLRRNEAINSTGEYVKKYDDAATDNDPLYIVRIAEMYLIAAEAAAAQNDFINANTYINAVRNRAGLPDVSLDANNYIDLILQERNAELCFEGPHRWLDLKRTGKDIDILEELGDYTATDRLWPFPTSFLDAFDLLNQNDGY